ncbi:MAG: hypothetical protein EAZ14_05400 [Runella slithyformis]|nr:MAG: hypothetical protein EAZ14_05400 [Runella slithyformis]
MSYLEGMTTKKKYSRKEKPIVISLFQNDNTMKIKHQPTATQLTYEYAVVDKKLARANENLKDTTIEQLRALKAEAIRKGK